MSAWGGSVSNPDSERAKAKHINGGARAWLYSPEQIARNLGKAKRVGREWTCLCPAHDDHDPSLGITEKDGRILVCCRVGCPQDAVIGALQSRGLWPSAASTSTSKKSPPRRAPGARQRAAAPEGGEAWDPIVPPPHDALKPDLAGCISYEYVGADGRLLFYQRRFEKPEGKRFGQLTYGVLNGKRGWHDKGPAQPYPLYRLDQLTNADPETTVIVVEGEKACHAAERLFPDAVVTTWLNGAASVPHTDWSPIRRFKRVIWWADADKPRKDGKPHGCFIATPAFLKLFPAAVLLDTASLDDIKDGYDCADLEQRGCDDPEAWLQARLKPAPENDPPDDTDAIRCLDLPKLASFQQIPPRSWAYGRFLLFGSAAVLGAVDGTGKGFITVAHILSLVTGKPLLGERVWRAGPVGIITYEDDPDEWLRRIAAACIHYEIDYNEVRPHVFFLHRPGGRVVLAQRMSSGETLYPDSAAIIAKLKERKAVALIVDPFNSAHLMDDGNSNVQIVRVAMELTQIAKAADVAVLVLHHLRKGSTGTADDLMGAVSLRANFQVCRILQIMSGDDAERMSIPEGERFRYLRISGGKENYAPRASKAIWFKLVSLDLGNGTDAYPEGDSVAVAVSWVPPSPFQGISMEGVHDILDAIRKGAANGERYSPRRKATLWVGNLIAEHTGRTSDQAADILAAWLDSKLLLPGKYQDKHRHERDCVTVNEALAGGMFGRQRTTPENDAENDAE